jgi:cell fate regulator YaaT (PSP1 superfamily)
VYRKASERDLEKWAEARAREKQTMMQSRDVAQRLGLKMKISMLNSRATVQKRRSITRQMSG